MTEHELKPAHRLAFLLLTLVLAASVWIFYPRNRTGKAGPSSRRQVGNGTAGTTTPLDRANTPQRVLWQAACDRSIGPLAFSPDGSLLASGFEEPVVSVWSMEARTQNWLRGIDGEAGGPVTWSPDGKTVACGEASGSDTCEVFLFEAQSGSLVQTLRGHPLAINSITVSPDGRTLASASGNFEETAHGQEHQIVEYEEIRLWNLRRGSQKRILRWRVPERGAADLALFLRDGRTLQSLSTRGIVRRLDLRTGRMKSVVTGISEGWWTAVFSQDGKTLATGSGNKETRSGKVRIWDIQSGRLVRVLSHPGHWVRALAFSPDGHRLASGEGIAESWCGTCGRVR
jgi:WD40 repeat protein